MENNNASIPVDFELLKTAFEHVPCAIMIADKGLNGYYANAYWKQILAHKKRALSEPGLCFLFDEREKAAIVKRFEDGKVSDSIKIATSFIATNNEPKHLTVTIKGLADVSGEQYYVCSAIDVSDQKVAEDMLRKNDQELNTILASLYDIVFELDEEFRFLSCWTRDEKMLIMPREVFLGKKLTELFEEEFRGPFVEAIEKVKATGNRYSIEYPYEVSGDRKWFRSTCSMILENGEATNRISMLIQDVTREKGNELSLQKTNRLLDSLGKLQAEFMLDENNSNNTFTDLLATLLSVSDGEYGFLGEILKTDEGAPFLKCQAISDLTWSEDTRRLYEKHHEQGFEFYDLNTLYGSVITSNEPVIANDPSNDSRRGGLPKGHPPLKAFMGLPVMHDNEMIGMIGVANKPGGYSPADIELLQPILSTYATFIIAIRSVRQRERAEEELLKAKEAAEKAATAKSEFLSMMSHEIRTPLNAVIGLSHVLLQGKLTAEQANNLQLLQNSAESLLRLINDLLDFGKIDAGKVVLEKTEFNLKQLVDKIRRPYIIKAQEQGSIIHTYFDDKVPAVLIGDPVQLGQIITNLLSNAIKFTVNGQITINVSLEQVESSGATLKVIVADTGIGIPKDKQSLIFDSFTQASSSTTRRYGGSGLGLTITKRLLELSGSRIELQSTPNVGSEFSFVIKLGIGDEVEFYTRKSEDYKQKNFNGVNVLLVEDNPLNRLVAKKFLVGWGAIVDEAENGLEALKKCLTTTYDIILMDLQMPEMDGFTATSNIRYDNEKVPIIALTATTVVTDDELYEASGFTDFIAKPFHPNDLNAKMGLYLNKKSR